MIKILYGTGVIANNDGTPVNAPSYWSDEIQAKIQATFELGEGVGWEPVPDPEPPPPEPDWVGFIVEFNLPGNSLYNATATKVQASGEVTKEHWFNLKLGLNISEIRSIEWLQLSYNYLLFLLEVNNQALTIEEKQAWLDMANKHNITIE